MSDPVPTPSDSSAVDEPEVTSQAADEQVTDQAPQAEASTTDTTNDSQQSSQEGKVDQGGEEWRKKWSGGDAKIEKRLERYSSEKDVVNALIAAQNKISSGELKSALKPDASDEEKAQWREENGIPDSPEGYEINLPEGLVIGEADKPVVDGFLKFAHEANYHPSQVNKAMEWYYQEQDRQMQAQEEFDIQSQQSGEDELHAEWGQDYRKNVQLAMNLLDQAPGGLKERIMGARLADGVALGNDPDALRWLTGLSREINPVATVVPGSGANAMQAIESEISNLRSMMGDHTSEYWKGPNAEKNQARYRELTTAMQKHG